MAMADVIAAGPASMEALATRPNPRAAGYRIAVLFGRKNTWKKCLADLIDGTKYTYNFANFSTDDLGEADCIVPLGLADYPPLRRQQGRYGNKYFIPPVTAVTLCDDKLEFNRMLLGTRFASLVPPLYRRATVRFPYIIKRREGSAGNGMIIVRDADAEAELPDTIRTADSFRQAYVPGDVEYATHMLIVDGQLIFCSTNQYVMPDEFTIRGRVRPLQTNRGFNMDQATITEFVDILTLIAYEGACCVNYKVADGRVWVLEINPRVGDTLRLDINAYLDAYNSALHKHPAGNA
jgi:hypothetical protein